ncbi:unnamed protein product [Rhizopus stolonifer]
MPTFTEPKVENINIYPIKSCHGIQVEECQTGYLGVDYDRQFMMIEEDTNKFITQRKYPSLCLLYPKINIKKNVLTLTAQGQEDFELPLQQDLSQLPQLTIKLWKDTLVLFDLGQGVADWLTQFLILHKDHTDENDQDEVPRVRLVTIDPGVYSRPAHPNLPGVHLPLTDESPISMGCLTSLEEINKTLENKIPMSRFRNNINISGTVPWEEDHWLVVSIGEATFYIVQPTARCPIPNIDQDTGKKDAWCGPTDHLKKVRQFREEPGKGQFCCDVIPLTFGKVRVGDNVKVLERIPKDHRQFPIQ